MLAEAPLVYYIHEPFSVTHPPGRGICNLRFTNWFTLINYENEFLLFRHQKHPKLRYNWLAAVKSCAPTHAHYAQIFNDYRTFKRLRHKGARTLVKDPIALFSAEWLARRFDMAVVVMIRHPAAFVSSIKKLNWSHPFSHFLKQPLLMKTILYPFEAEIDEYARNEKGIIEQGVLLWRITHHAIRGYRERHKNWIFLRHEDVSRSPMEEFQALYDKFGLELTSRALSTISEYSKIGNPKDSDAVVGSEATLRRDSRSNVLNWKERLTPAEIETIKEGVRDLSPVFYSDEDW